MSFPKRGYFECEPVRAFMKRGACSGCGEPADDPSHFPSRGAGGDDFGVFPACRPCHGKMQRYEAPFSREWQTQASGEALVRFLRNANELERKAFVRAWERYISERVFVEIPA